MNDELIEKLVSKKELYIKVKVLPSASKTELKNKLEDDTYKIAVSAPPEKGKANKELIKFLAKEFKLKKEKIKIISGANSRLKIIKLSCFS